MQEITTEYLARSKQDKRMNSRFWSIAAFCSLIVVLCVFWYLKLTGITMAGEAFCGLAEHVHSDSCRQLELVCTAEEGEGHTHTDECYNVIKDCPLAEHIHVESCYSDIKADLETEEDWIASLEGLTPGSSTAENVLLVAQSQLGCGESTLNFEIGADGVRRGITRYGQWYGNPYGDWNAMFVSFCLEYAGAYDVPLNSGPEAMRLKWEEADIYIPAEEYAPQVGDILFLHKTDGSAQNESTDVPEGYDYEGAANSVAVIVEISPDKIKVIEGDVDGIVTEVEYDITSEEILGYGLVPNVSDFALMVESAESGTTLATVTAYNSSMLTSSDRFVFYYTYNGSHYAFDGSGNAVPVSIDANGTITADVDDPDLLLWTISRYNNSSYAIHNVGSGRYLHPFYNGASDNGITTPGRWGTTVSASGNGVKFSHSAYISFNSSTRKFEMSRAQSSNVTFNIGVRSTYTVWLDGTNGGIMSLGGSDDTAYTVDLGSTLTLPESWKSPDKYEYVLKGWYDVTNHKYYRPGDTVTVTGNTVFYADWMAASYDVGKFNSQTVNTVSTKSFVTTRMFDYGVLLNVLSEKVTVSADSASHTETWELLTSGNNPYNGDPTLNFIFRDWDRGNEDISYPKNHNDINNPTEAGTVYQGLYTDTIREMLFNPDVILPGKTYLGEADHLFQLCEDEGHSHYGYYYYNSERNAASYNQTNQRFYVYDYLECTRDSLNSGDNGKYSDFLPLNSPYTNTNGKSPTIYTYEGVEGEYVGTSHYMYDSKYSDSNNSVDKIGTNYLFGMSIEVDFYLPNDPGIRLSDGEYGNKDVYGDDMHFRFTGDDDVWIFVDDKLVLDLGGLHGRESGDINFATGVVTINGVQDDALTETLKSITAGEHKLTMFYLERGSSLSNCAIYFNLAPRFAFSIQKEDVLTREVLNGAEFSVYTDRECTIPAELWTSKEAHDNDEHSTNVFKVVNGVANMWGMGAGNEYYIRETKPPDNKDYGFAHGTICITFDKNGTANYNVEIIDDDVGVSPGFIVHGFRIDAETQQAYIVATNAPKWVEETTVIQVMKKWNDSLSHSGDSVTVYLTVTDEDGAVRRLQEATISEATNWMARWENLPKYAEDGVTPIKYGVEESYVSGYYSTVEHADGEFEIATSKWQDTTSFENGKVYLIKNSEGLALSTQRYAEDTGYMWVTPEVAKGSDLALWLATVNGNTVRLTNLAGQTITFWYGNGSPTDFFAYNRHIEDNNRKQFFTFTTTQNGLQLRYSNYYMYSALNSSQKFQSGTGSSSALLITPCTEVVYNSNVSIEDQGFLIGNTPLEKETSVSVTKDWDIPHDMDSTVYEQEQITVRLLADGVDTGRTVTLNLKNDWKAVFLGLPYTDADGNVINYTVREVVPNDQWAVSYGDVIATGSSPPQYSIALTNTYRTGGPILPSTGSPARLIYMLCGAGIIACTLIYGLWYSLYRERRKR